MSSVLHPRHQQPLGNIVSLIEIRGRTFSAVLRRWWELYLHLALTCRWQKLLPSDTSVNLLLRNFVEKLIASLTNFAKQFHCSEGNGRGPSWCDVTFHELSFKYAIWPAIFTTHWKIADMLWKSTWQTQHTLAALAKSMSAMYGAAVQYEFLSQTARFFKQTAHLQLIQISPLSRYHYHGLSVLYHHAIQKQGNCIRKVLGGSVAHILGSSERNAFAS